MKYLWYNFGLATIPHWRRSLLTYISAAVWSMNTSSAHKDSRLLRRAKDELRHVTCAVSTVECVLFWIEFCVSESFPNVENRCRRGVSTCRKFYKKVADKGYNAILFRRLLFWPSGRGTERCAWWRGWRCPGAAGRAEVGAGRPGLRASEANKV